MTRKWWIISIPGGLCILSFLILSFINTARPPAPVRIFGVGNGYMADQPLTSKTRGWMQMLPMFFAPNLHFENLSQKDRSLADFMQYGHWDTLLKRLKPDDYVVISFVPLDPGARVANSDHHEQELLKKMLTGIDRIHAHAVLLMPDISGEIKQIHAPTDLKATILDYSSILGSHKYLAKNANDTSALPMLVAIDIAKVVAKQLKEHFSDGQESENLSPDTAFQARQTNIISKKTDPIAHDLELEASRLSRKDPLPGPIKDWPSYATHLRATLMQLSGARPYHDLPLDYHETGRISQKGYSIRKIYFQTAPHVYATANLYVPDGKGPFPAVINMHGHWPDAKAGEMVQSCAMELAANGYVCLNIDAWGGGERTSQQGIQEYHGANLGASLMNIGQTLLGRQVTDNMRGVDLLCSLAMVDKNNIGATGASGGGNQTMWLAALDTRIKAAMPVVSVGTFQAYIMNSNCVCELMPSGFTYTEEAGVLALIAPRSLKLCSGLQDANAAFSPVQMLRSYYNAVPVFKALHQAENIRYQLFNTPHGYWPEIQSAMIAWFNLKLKNKGDAGFDALKRQPLLDPQQLLVFDNKPRSPLITTTISYCRQIGDSLREDMMKHKQFDVHQKKLDLKRILMLPGDTDQVAQFQNLDANTNTHSTPDAWQNIILTTHRHHLIPIRFLPPKKPGNPILIICPPDSAGSTGHYSNQFIQKNFAKLIQASRMKGYGIVQADLWGIDKNGSITDRSVNGALPLFHTLARAELWLGHSVMGEWVEDMRALTGYFKSKYHPVSISIAAGKEIAVAALAGNALFRMADHLFLSHCPYSYVLDRREGMDYFNMGVHIPHLLQWGDIGLMAALNTGVHIEMNSPVSITGHLLNAEERKQIHKDYQYLNTACAAQNSISFD